MVDDILEQAKDAVEKIEDFEGKIRLIGQYDADGISATAIAHEMLTRMGKEFEYEILKQLYEEDVERIAEEDEELIFFVDIGSGQSKAVQKHIVEDAGKDVIVSDHHEPQIEGDFIHLNPHFLGLDGGEAISAAGMTYLIAEAANKEENIDLVQYALIGATGDIQKQEGEFLGLNKQLLERAEENNLIDKRKGLSLYGRTTKPLYKSLMYTSDPYLEGISNNESGAIQFLKSCGVEIRDEDGFRTLADMSEEEEKKIIHGLITQGYDAGKLLQNIYTLNNGKGIDEFSTTINACGRLGEPKTGVKILLENDLKLAKKISRKYGRKIAASLRYVENNKDNEDAIYEKDIGIIDGKDEIEDDFIGTVTTISMSNGLFEDRPVILGVAESEKDKAKVSCRARKDAVENGLNLGEILEAVCEEVEGEGGGHNVAGGAKIPLEEKENFIERVNEEVMNVVNGEKVEVEVQE